MQIELNDHVGVSPNGERVDHNQWVVMCDGIHVGYLQKIEGAWLSCIVFMDEATKTELIEAVSAAAHQRIDGAAVPVDPDFLNDEGENDDIDESDAG
jgi:hypothetical protein